MSTLYEEDHECDRCDASMVENVHARRPMALDFVTTRDDDPQSLETEIRVLCSACEEELLEWIDEGEVDRSGKVDLPDRLVAADALTQTADELDALADDLESALDPEDHA